MHSWEVGEIALTVCFFGHSDPSRFPDCLCQGAHLGFIITVFCSSHLHQLVNTLDKSIQCCKFIIINFYNIIKRLSLPTCYGYLSAWSTKRTYFQTILPFGATWLFLSSLYFWKLLHHIVFWHLSTSLRGFWKLVPFRCRTRPSVHKYWCNPSNAHTNLIRSFLKSFSSRQNTTECLRLLSDVPQPFFLPLIQPHLPLAYSDFAGLDSLLALLLGK